MSRITLHTLLCIILTGLLPACAKLLNKEPISELTGEQLFSNDQSATAVVLGITNKMMEAASFFNGQSSRYLGLYTGEITRVQMASRSDSAFFNNEVKPEEQIVLEWWNGCFNYVYLANSALLKLTRSTELTPAVREQLTGEVLFLRSLYYFYLVNLFGDVPLVLDTDPAVTKLLLKSPKAVVYRNAINDLLKAYRLVGDDYPSMPDRPSNRCRVNKGAVAALLAKVFLHTGEYSNAINWSTRVLNDKRYSLEQEPNNVFLAQSKETIFGLYPTHNTYNTVEGRLFLTLVGKPLFALDTRLVQTFEPTDTRLQKWMNRIQVASETYWVPYKYKVYASTTVQEYTVLLRLAEVYLIRAEAWKAGGKLTEAVQDINVVHRRAGLSDLPVAGLNAADVTKAIEVENRLEFFAELGHWFIDLKRWKTIYETLAIIKPGKWKDYMINLPIPRVEVQKSSITQNEGYTD